MSGEDGIQTSVLSFRFPAFSFQFSIFDFWLSVVKQGVGLQLSGLTDGVIARFFFRSVPMEI